MLTFITFTDRIKYKHYKEIVIMSKYHWSIRTNITKLG